MDLPIRLTESFWGDVVVNVVAGAIAVIIGKLLLVGADVVRAFFQLRRSFSIAGAWIGTCKLPNYGPDVEAVEIYRIVVRGERVDISLFNYRPDSAVIQLCRGLGIWRSHLLSAYYYAPDPTNTESGVFVLRLSGNRLKGTYAQYDVESDEQLAVGMETFELRRVALTTAQQVRLALGVRPVASHTAARALYESVMRVQPVLDPLNATTPP